MRLSLLPLLCCYAALDGQAPSPPPPLFRTAAPLSLILEGDLRGLLRDRGEQRTEHAVMLRFRDGSDTGSVKVDLRTRGIFRLKRCSFPPIRIDLPTRKLDATPFAGQDKLKIVTHCQGDRSYERNLLREYALYRVFNALTDTSFQVRLAHVTYIDSARADTTIRYAFLIESDVALTRRVGATAAVVEADKVHDALTDAPFMTLVAVFQYLIGNTDWSVWGRHNIVILGDTVSQQRIAVPYDFDFAGAVNASYAIPPEQLPIKSVRERLYRGFCQPDSLVHRVLDRFRIAKDSIYAAVRAVPDLPERDVRSVLEYFDDFYRGIENQGTVRREFLQRCRKVTQ